MNARSNGLALSGSAGSMSMPISASLMPMWPPPCSPVSCISVRIASITEISPSCAAMMSSAKSRISGCSAPLLGHSSHLDGALMVRRHVGDERGLGLVAGRAGALVVVAAAAQRCSREHDEATAATRSTQVVVFMVFCPPGCEFVRARGAQGRSEAPRGPRTHSRKIWRTGGPARARMPVGAGMKASAYGPITGVRIPASRNPTAPGRRTTRP
jgi:hypothetical protein